MHSVGFRPGHQAIRMAITVPGEIHRDVTIEKFNVKNSNSSQLHEIALKKLWQCVAILLT